MDTPEYTRDEALAFIESLRLTLGDRVGFRWLVRKLSDLAAYVEFVAAEDERLNAYLDWAGARGDYEAYCAESSGADLPGDAPGEGGRGEGMASDMGFVEYVCDQIGDAGRIRSRKMFGEFAIYCDDKVVALVCDDRLFVRPTSAGRAFIGEPVEAPPYQGAKPHFLIEDRIDDRDWLTELIRVTEHETPVPKPKKPKKPSSR